MRRHLVIAGSSILLLANATGVAAANSDDDDDGSHEGRDPVVVAAGLDNPRGLGWLGHHLLVAEGGVGGDDCDEAGEVCTGSTSRVSAIDHPFLTRDGEAATLVDGLVSMSTPEAVIGASDVAATGFPGVLLITQGEPLGDGLADEANPATATQEHLLISVDGEVFPWVDFGQIEADEDPDGNGVLDSNPNAVIIVDPTPESGPGNDEYALVAGAGANTVYKVDPDFETPDENGLPTPTVTVFEAFPPTAVAQFVPSALDQDEDGNVYVGGVGSLIPGAASVVRLDPDGDETARWDGFTGINGLAVDEDGGHVYVSQIVGPNTDFANPSSGNVVRLDTEDETWTAVDIPRPSGLALGEDARDSNRHIDQWREDGDDDDDDRGIGWYRDNTVFVAAFSTSAGDADDPATDVVEGGQVQRFRFPKDAEEHDLPVTTPPTAPPGGEPAP
jgi:hypothetical protein